MTLFMYEIEGRTLNKDRENEWIWNDRETQDYMVKYAYKRLNSRIKDEETFLYKLFWKTKTLPTTQHFSWHLIINKIATQDKMQYKGIELYNGMCVCVNFAMK